MAKKWIKDRLGRVYVDKKTGLPLTIDTANPLIASTPEEKLALLVPDNHGAVMLYEGNYYLIDAPRIYVGDTITELYFDKSWLPYVYNDFILGTDEHTLIETGKATVVYTENGEEFIREVQEGLAAQNIDDPQQAELAWWDCNFDRLEVNYEDGTYTVDGKVVTEEEANTIFGCSETVVYRDYEEFWAYNGKPTGWLVDHITFDTPVKVTAVHNRDLWEGHIFKTKPMTWTGHNGEGVGYVKLHILDRLLYPEATAEDVLEGKKFYTGDGEVVTGVMPDVTESIITQEIALASLEEELNALPQNEDITTELSTQEVDLTSLEEELNALPQNEDITTELTKQETDIAALAVEINKL